MALQERGIRTRRLILEAAAEAFAQNGYEGASTTAILARAGLTRGALYHHFSSKEAIAAALVDAQTQALVVPDRPTKLQALIDLTLRFAHDLLHDSVLQASVRLTVEQTSFREGKVTAYQRSAEVILEVLRDAEARGELLPGLEVEDVAQLIVGAFTGLQLMSHLYTEREDLAHRVAVMWRCMLPGIAAPGLVAHLSTNCARMASEGRSDVLPATAE
ncbi:ScbR family autoregulator-binding transcription factor [Streptomyces sudanensis]|uniref:ScbR family autoregulator-binding transcription factor n=1 Tax=Streptomyces sudanensis TaxID=436397 RepID=UPI0020CF28E4|nr:ScbR family autoregulator-binding transcription factor [Streptomyces sudanensis]MCP9958672.1 TetR/AcrR family transcriptional regulator [Streptomyces sudanensis]MCQ0000833.1 TetR/AcrR family transcriptional regulator [Streptomyces sudanensis]